MNQTSSPDRPRACPAAGPGTDSCASVLRLLGPLPESMFRIPGHDSLLALSKDEVCGPLDVYREKVIRRFVRCPIDPGADRAPKRRPKRRILHGDPPAIEFYVAVSSFPIAGDAVDDQ